MKLRQTELKNHPALKALKKQFNIKPLRYGGYWLTNKTTEGFLGTISGCPGLWLCADVKDCWDKWSKCPMIVNLDTDHESKLRAIRKCFNRPDAFDWSNCYRYYEDPRESIDEFHV